MKGKISVDRLPVSDEVKNEVKTLSEEIINLVHPLSIYLFGSSVRNELEKDSDLDFMVVVPNDIVNKRQIAGELYSKTSRFEHSLDFIVATPEQLEKYKNFPYYIYRSVLQEGIKLYEK